MKLLFLCTHNACRSILCEAIFNQLGNGTLQAKSAGSAPANDVHPLTLQNLQAAGYKTEGLSSKHSDALADFSPDAVITVCDSAAKESCPVYFGPAVKAHWGLPDPSKMTGSEQEIEEVFQALISRIELLAHQFLAAKINFTGPNITLKNELNRIGEINNGAI